jgi:hypothetical protein
MVIQNELITQMMNTYHPLLAQLCNHHSQPNKIKGNPCIYLNIRLLTSHTLVCHSAYICWAYTSYRRYQYYQYLDSSRMTGDHKVICSRKLAHII